ncbi:MAG: molybdopterin-dependent oxidoreductase, partial [Rubricella sp.]
LDGAEVVWNLGADEGDIPAGPFVIYQGSHGDRGAHRADVILPAACYTEEAGLFVNTEGRPQMALRANFPPGEAKENWAIIRAASAHLGATLPHDSLADLRAALFEAVPHLAEIDTVPENDGEPLPAGSLGDQPFGQAIGDFYLTNPIARASQVMAECSKLAASDYAVAAE